MSGLVRQKESSVFLVLGTEEEGTQLAKNSNSVYSEHCSQASSNVTINYNRI